MPFTPADYEAIIIEIQCENAYNLNVGNIYRGPGTSFETFNHLTLGPPNPEKKYDARWPGPPNPDTTECVSVTVHKSPIQ